MEKKTLNKIDEAIESLCAYIKAIADTNRIAYDEEIVDTTKTLAELLIARLKICETEQLEQQKDMFQHIRITGYDGVYSAIDIDSTEEGTTYAIFKPDNSRGVNLLCEIRDVNSLIYLANTSCTTVNAALK